MSMRVCVHVCLILVLVWKTLIWVLVWGTYYVPATYVPGISRQTTVWYQVLRNMCQLRMYVPGISRQLIHPPKKICPCVCVSMCA